MVCNNNQIQTLDVSFDESLRYVNCRYNQITDFRTIGSNNIQQVACQWNY